VTFLLSVWSLWKREIVRFLRQRSRVFGALAPPLGIWLLIGSGLGSSFHLPGAQSQINYLQYFFPGTILLVILFTAIFSSISVIEDRREGFLLSVLVAPISRQAIVLGKILGSTSLAFVQGILLLFLSPLLGIELSIEKFFLLSVVLLVVSLGLSALGFAAAWKTESMEGFHSVMNVLLFPMWLLSGAVFPAEGAFTWIRWIMRVNPLYYSLSALQDLLHQEASQIQSQMVGLGPAFAVTVVFGLTMIVLSVFLVARGKLTGYE
jgi:ABC-2 type transport system permease protein